MKIIIFVVLEYKDKFKEQIVIEGKFPMEILNQYRNLYYKELKDTERGIMAMVINDIFMKAKQLGVLDELNKQ